MQLAQLSRRCEVIQIEPRTIDGVKVKPGDTVYAPDGTAYTVRHDLTIAAAVCVPDPDFPGEYSYRDLLASECRGVKP